jgi:hypothetical protein
VQIMSLQPNKNNHPDLTVISASTLILKRLKSRRVESYSGLYDALNKSNKHLSTLFNDSLEFLFLLGLIEYHTKNDLIEYTGL